MKGFVILWYLLYSLLFIFNFTFRTFNNELHIGTQEDRESDGLSPVRHELTFPTLKTSMKRWLNMAAPIIKDPYYLGHALFSLLLSGRMYRSLMTTPSGLGIATFLQLSCLQNILQKTNSTSATKHYKSPLAPPWTYFPTVHFCTNALFFCSLFLFIFL